MSNAQDTTAAILQERGSRYGVFTGHADVTQRLKEIIRTELKQRGKVLANDQQEALDMICHKIGRIINGDANYDDSWADIAGYARLVADRLQGKGEHAPKVTLQGFSQEFLSAIAAARPGEIVAMSDEDMKIAANGGLVGANRVGQEFR